MSRTLKFLFCWILFLSLLSAPGFAQLTGTFQGTVTDSTGAVLPGVTVTILNVNTGETRTVLTGDNGFYRATNVPLGVYELRGSLAGFKTGVHTGIELTVGRVQRVDFTLEIGEISEEIVVAGEVPLVDTEQGRMTSLITGDQIANLPLNGRNIFQLAQLQPGILSVAGTGLQASGSSSFVAQGNRHRGTNYLLDGADNNDAGIGGVPVIVPVQDAVEEFQLSTTNFPAEFGRNAGAVVEVVTKSGTNELHGSVWEFHRNAALDAREFTDDEDPAPLIQHQFGFTLGGPIQRDNAWFFGYYEGERTGFGETSSFQVEDPAFASAFLADSVLGQTRAAELLRRHPAQSAPNATSTTAADFMSSIVAEGGPTFGEGFSGNWFADWDGDGDVDAADMDVAADFWNSNFGVQLAPGQLDGLKSRATAFWNLLRNNPSLPILGNTTFGPRQKFSGDQYSIRIDTEFNDGRDRFFGRWTQVFQDQNVNNIGNKAARQGITDPFEGSANNLLLSHTHTFSPSVINEIRAAWNKGRGDFFAVPDPLPEANIGGASDVPGFGAYSGLPQLFTTHTFQYTDTLSWNTGSHGIKLGGELRKNVENGLFDVSTRGSFTFYGLADFALDEPGFEFIAFSPLALSTSPPECASTGFSCNWEFPDMARYFRNWEWGLFVSDDWKVSRNFSLNLGLRYDFYGVPFEIRDRESNLIFGSGSTVFERVANAGRFDPLAVKTGQVQFNPNLVDTLFDEDRNNFSPRLGFAWDPFGDGRTSVRGGYSIGYDRLFFNVTSNTRFNPPLHAFGVFLNFVGNNVGPSFDIDNKLGRLPPEGSPPSIFAVSRISLRTPDPDIATSYVQNWFFGLQREWFSDWMLEANYVGSAGRKLSLIEDYNRFAGDRFGATDPFGLGRPANRAQTRLHDDFTTTGLRSNSVNSIYHAAQFQARKRFSGGWALQANYTVSKLIDTDTDVFGASGDDITTLDPTRVFLERSLSSLDATQRFNANFIYEVPFMREQSGIFGKLLGGWQLNGSVILQSGRPFSIVVPDTSGNGDFVGGDRPNGTFDRKLGETSPSVFKRDVKGAAPCSFSSSGGNALGDTVTLSPNCKAGLFAGKEFTSVLGQVGQIGRNTFRGPGFANANFAVFKNFAVRSVTEDFRIQFRAEFFNIFNRVNLAPVPQARVNNPNFGTSGSSFDAREIQFALKILF